MEAEEERLSTGRRAVGQRRARWWLPGVVASLVAVPAIGYALRVATGHLGSREQPSGSLLESAVGLALPLAIVMSAAAPLVAVWALAALGARGWAWLAAAFTVYASAAAVLVL